LGSAANAGEKKYDQVTKATMKAVSRNDLAPADAAVALGKSRRRIAMQALSTAQA
jgi:hypothetical protein